MTLAGEVETFLRHVEQGEAAAAVDGVLALHDSGLSCSDIVTEVLAPAQLEVGARWATAQWSVADEHVATAAVDDALGALSARLEPTGGPTVALCSAEGEWHVTPLRMGALLLREQGLQVRMFGASTPAEHLRGTLRHAGADVVAIHCVLPTHLHGVPGVAAAAHDAGMPVLAAGQGFGGDEHRALHLGCEGWAPDVVAAARLAEEWATSPPPRREALDPRGGELGMLRDRQHELVGGAYRLLQARQSIIAGHDDRQRRQVLADLDHLVDAAATTLLVDDRRVLQDHLAWLQMVLVARGVPAAVLDEGLAALVEVATPELPTLAALLDPGAHSG